MSLWQPFTNVYLPTTDKAVVVTDGKHYDSTTPKRVIVALHGHGSDAFQGSPVSAVFAYYRHLEVLAESGRYLVASIDGNGTLNWSNPGTMTAITNARTWLRSLVSAPTKIGLLPYSMGGADALNWIKRNPTLSAGMYGFAPLTDLDWAHATSGYTPAYTYFAPGAGYAAEMETAFATNAAGWAAAAAGYKIRDEYASWTGICPITIAQASDDATLPPAQATAFVNGVNDANVKLRSPAPTGGHTGLFSNIDPAETLAFFDSLSWS